MHHGCYYGKYSLWGMDDFHHYFVRKGHGVVGKAYSSQNACFCGDIRHFNTTEYPLAPSARKYGFSSCFAICLQSSCLHSCIYTLELILPTNEASSRDPWTLLSMIIESLRECFQKIFKVASGQKLGQHLFVEVVKITPDDELDSFEIGHATGGECAPTAVKKQNEVGMTPLDGLFLQAEAAQQHLIVGSAPVPKHVQNVESTRHQQRLVDFDAAIVEEQNEVGMTPLDDSLQQAEAAQQIVIVGSAPVPEHVQNVESTRHQQRIVDFDAAIVEEQNEVGMTPLDDSSQQAEAAQQIVIVGSAPVPEHVQNVESTRHQQQIVDFDAAIVEEQNEVGMTPLDDSSQQAEAAQQIVIVGSAPVPEHVQNVESTRHQQRIVDFDAAIVEEQNEVGMTPLDDSSQQAEAAQKIVIVGSAPVPEHVQNVESTRHQQQIVDFDAAIVEEQNEVGMTPLDDSLQQAEAAQQIVIVGSAPVPEHVQNVESTRHQQRIVDFDAAVVEEQNEVGMTPLDDSSQQAEAAQKIVIVGSAPVPEHVQNVESTRHQQRIVDFGAAIPARDDASMEHDGNARDDASVEHDGNARDDADGNARDDACMEHDGNARDVTINLRKRASAHTLGNELGITLEVLEEYSALKVADAAKALGVSRSTLKRICRTYNIHRWPPRKARKYDQATDQQEIAQPSKKNIGEHSMSVATGLPDDSSIVVKATYEDIIIKFQLSLSARKMDLVEKVAMRLNLPVGNFKIMYLDEEDDWVSITCDEDLSMSLSMLRSVGKTMIRMLVSL